jgi:uncharacterized protein YodC (DUF2158 family)
MALRIGAKVQLISGGPVMAVTAVRGQSISCIWFVKGTLRKAKLPAAVLENHDRVGKLLQEIKGDEAH